MNTIAIGTLVVNPRCRAERGVVVCYHAAHSGLGYREAYTLEVVNPPPHSPAGGKRGVITDYPVLATTIEGWERNP